MRAPAIILLATLVAPFGLSGSFAFAGDLLYGVTCQPVDSREVLRADLGVENFNSEEQGFIVCQAADGESMAAQPQLIAGALPLRSTGTGTISLEDFSIWQQSPDLSELFVQSSLGQHRVRAFDPDARAISAQDADAFLGFSHSRPVQSQVCEPVPGSATICTIEQVEVCGWNYNRWECKLVDKEVCRVDENCEQICHEETTYVYFRRVASITGTVAQVSASYCPYGIVHRRERFEYSRLVQERQCCESKVVSGVLTNVCSTWERY